MVGPADILPMISAWLGFKSMEKGGVLRPLPTAGKEKVYRMGSVFQRGKVWWIKYYKDGKPYRESSRSRKKTEAERLLKMREGSIVQGAFHGLQVERIKVNELLDDVISEYRLMERKSLVRQEESVSHLKGFFGGIKACHVTTTHIQSYMLARQEAGAKNATINRELSALRRAYTLGVRHTPPKVTTVPHIPKLKESNVRTGFFEYDEYAGLRDALPDDFKPLLIAGYYTGMRRGELLDLQWPQIDIWSHRIVLNPGSTKNGEGRVVFMYGELFDAILAQKKFRDATFPVCQHVFFDHTTGEPLPPELRIVWERALKLSGLEGKLFHDLRRTAVRNMVRAGVPEVVAMKISGHKTRSIFDRYNITSEEDIKHACQSVSNMHQENSAVLAKAEDGHKTGTLKVLQGGRQ
jgi:integrase